MLLKRATDGDCVALAARMRPADRLEVLAAGSSTPLEALRGSLSGSQESYAGYIDGEPAVVFGVKRPSMLVPHTIAWLLTGDVVNRYPLTFWRASKATTAYFREKYGTLVNFIDARHEQALRWAARLHFEIHGAVPIRRDGELFHIAVLRG